MAKIAVRARAVDMLGRQQIAGIPTAIHELFKNAYDAYANRVEVDFFRTDQLLVLRDDGIGMTREEFETRWLTLGTEAKVGTNAVTNSPLPSGMTKRQIMGEKGIGRLAIAAIGPLVLVLTRAGKSRAESRVVASLIHWGIFELPGIDLSEVEIPVVELPDDMLPDKSVMRSLTDVIRANVEGFSTVPDRAKASILRDLERAIFDVAEVSKGLGEPTLLGAHSGTHFFVRPVNEILAADIDSQSEDAASPLEKMLLGFSNTMMSDKSASQFGAEFRDHREDGVVEELISGSSFFTPQEFESADHHVVGTFDKHGQFSGTVTVYDQAPVGHQIAWPDAAGRETEAGPFNIAFGYVQGLPRDSRLPPDQWAHISAKLNRIGGLYVYRDGIRILPYGNSDFDFLNIERRRTKSAQDWYFSYRRLMGAIELSHRNNPNLVEKAGREGFRTNLAYRQMVSMLENFFSRLAIDFFRPTSIYGTAFNAQKAALNRDAEVLARRERLSRQRRQTFADSLTKFFDDLEHGVQAAKARTILADVKGRLLTIDALDDDERAATLILQIERDGRAALRKLVQECTLVKPRGLGLSRALQADWNAYVSNFEKVETEVLNPARDELLEMLSRAERSHNIDQRRRLTASIDARRQEATGEATKLRREVERGVDTLKKNVLDVLTVSVTQMTSQFEHTVADLSSTDVSTLPDREINALQVQLEGRIEESANQTQAVLTGLRDQLTSLATALGQAETLDETTGALEGQVEAYREQLDSYVELAQVGMALGIVQHEFSNSVRVIKGAIRKLRPWGAGTPELNVVYNDIKNGFEHLESYLGLFTPMSRRLNRAAVDLSGEEIRNYLDEVFGDRIHRHKIVVTATPQFKRKKVHGYASTFLPVFVNLVDNAIYWMTTIPRANAISFWMLTARNSSSPTLAPGLIGELRTVSLILAKLPSRGGAVWGSTYRGKL